MSNTQVFQPQRLSQPVQLTAKTADGRIVPAQYMGADRTPVNRKLLIVLGYYADDKTQAEELADLICDLERIKNREADFMIYRRHDAPEPSRQTMDKLNDKFEKVHSIVCRRKDGNSYPFSSNQMFYDLVTLVGQTRQWTDQYFAFINLEPDCVPLRPGWIRELIDAFGSAEKRGASALGFIHNDPIRHLNGVAVYAIDIYNRVPGGKLGGGRPSVAFDVNQASNLLPLAEDTPLMYFDYRRPTIIPEDLFGPKRDGTEPAIYHGVKDRSARDAVREKFISFSAHKGAFNRNVFTFYHALKIVPDGEDQFILKLWQDGWRSRGWNPIVLRNADAARNRRYREFLDAITKFPHRGDDQVHVSRFIRWLALDTMGGSFLTDYDLLPGDFTPELAEGAKGFAVVDGQLSAAIMDRQTLGAWITEIRKYEPSESDQGNVTDASVLGLMLGENRIDPQKGMRVDQFAGGSMKDSHMVHFSRRAINTTPVRTKRKSELMETYLRGS